MFLPPVERWLKSPRTEGEGVKNFRNGGGPVFFWGGGGRRQYPTAFHENNLAKINLLKVVSSSEIFRYYENEISLDFQFQVLIGKTDF